MNEMKTILPRLELSNYFHSINFLYLKSEFAKHPTLGFMFIKWSSRDEWNEIHPSTKTTVKLYYCENFYFLKSEF